MMYNKKRPVLFIVPAIFFLWLAPLHAQVKEIKYLGIENGLSNNSVRTILQDRLGFMWFGTYDGLNRYDGYGFKVFRNIIGDSTSIKFNDINALEEANHRIWVAGHKGVSIYDPVTARFCVAKYLFLNSTSASPLSDNVSAVKKINDNNVLVGTQHNGLFLFKNGSNTGEQITLNYDNIGEGNGNITCLGYDEAKQVAYVFVQHVGLFTFNVATHTLTPESKVFTEGICIKVDRKGKLWLGTGNGLYQYDVQAKSYSANLLPSIGEVVNLCEDKKGEMWVATDGGGVWIFKADGSRPAPLPTAYGKPAINSKAVFAICEDSNNGKWIGTLRGGVNMISPRPVAFEKIVYNGQANNPADNYINAFYENGDGIWIGTSGSGLRCWNRIKNTYTSYVHQQKQTTSISSNTITSIASDGNNHLWLSTWFGGISRLNNKTGLFDRYTCYNPTTKLAENNVWLVYTDTKKRLWASTTNDGTLYLFNYSRNRFELFDDRIINIQCLAEDKEGNLWAGNYSSLIKIDPVNKRHIVYNLGYPVRSIYHDRQRNFWVGTQGAGLLLFNRGSGRFTQYTTTKGLPNNSVLRILEDKKSNLWMSTFNGLARFDVAKKTARSFFQSDGLQSNQFSFNASLLLQSGEFLFGGISGFNVFNPDSVYDQQGSTNLFLTALKIDNAPVEDQPEYVTKRDFEHIKKVTIPFDQAVVSIDYLALDYDGANKIDYAYYLQGWDKDWNYVNKIRTVNYSRLHEGTYLFKVKARGSNNQWSSDASLLTITVLPPWYRTWWAYSLYVLVVAGGVYLLYLYKVRKAALQYEVKLAHLETEKEKEINEKKLLFFTNIIHEFRTPLSLIINPIKDLLQKDDAGHERPELNVVYRNASRLLRIVDQLLLFKKTETEVGALNRINVNLNALCREVYACFLQQAKSKKISYTFSCTDNLIHLFADREKLEIALFNILSNAFKYTPDNGVINFNVQDTDTEVIITVADTGIGIPADTGERLFEKFYQVHENKTSGGFGIGLYLVKIFVEAHSGTVSYSSNHGSGTTFSMSLPRMPQPAIGDYLEDPAVSNVSHHVVEIQVDATQQGSKLDDMVSQRLEILIIDDDDEIRQYLHTVFSNEFKIYEADNGSDGLRLAHQHLPDLIVSDVVMKGIDGIDLCKTLKADSTISHIPVILLTGSASDDCKLQGIQSGAEDYIRKPFDKELLMARVTAILKRRNILQNYFYNEITLQTNYLKVSAEYKVFLERCIDIVEHHLSDKNFSIKTLATEIGMSHSSLYKKVKSVSGQSVNSFIRFIRLRKAAEMLISTEDNINQVAIIVGFNDIKYFREHFNKVFGMNPSAYVKKFRKSFHNTLKIGEDVRK